MTGTKKDLMLRMEQLEQANKQLQDDVIKLQHEKKALMQREGVVSLSEFTRLQKSLDNVRAQCAQWERLYDEKNEKCRKAVKELQELQQATSREHNERNAGRKRKLDIVMAQEIQKLKNENLTISEIARKLNISVGLVHKGIHTEFNF
jgi:hypothetical protein